MKTFRYPILGQEAIVHGGTYLAALGRVISWSDEPPKSYIEVKTHHDGVQRRYAPHNVSFADATVGMYKCASKPRGHETVVNSQPLTKQEKS